MEIITDLNKKYKDKGILFGFEFQPKGRLFIDGYHIYLIKENQKYEIKEEMNIVELYEFCECFDKIYKHIRHLFNNPDEIKNTLRIIYELSINKNKVPYYEYFEQKLTVIETRKKTPMITFGDIFLKI